MCAWCATVFEWIWEEFWSSVWRWVRDTIRRCNRRRCRWICGCCNRWLCWIAAILVGIVAFIVALILTLLATVVCAACYIVCVILCLLGILFGNTQIDACIEAWCQGLSRESDEEPSVDPQRTEPFDPGGGVPLAGGTGLTSGSALRRSSDVVRSSQPLTVRDAEQLRQINSWRRVLGGPTHVVLNLPGMSEKESKHWQTLLNRQIAACGCSEGAAFIIVGVLAYVLVVAFRTDRSLLEWTIVRTGLGVLIGAGLAGKAFGLIRSRARLSALIRQLDATAGGRK